MDYVRARGKFKRWKFEDFEGQEKWEEFLDALKLYGEYARAAESVNCSPKEIAKFRSANPWFQAFCDVAVNSHTSTLKEAAHSRAVVGSPRYALGGKDRDRAIQVETVYSDRLLEVALKRRDPTFGDKQTVEIVADVNLAGMFDFSSLSPRARQKLRELLEIIKEDAASAATEAQDDKDV